MVWVMDSQTSAQHARGIGDLAAQIEIELESKKRDLEDAYKERCKQLEEDRATVAAQYEEQRATNETSFKAELSALKLSHDEELSMSSRNQAALEASLDEANTQLYAYSAMISNYKAHAEISCRTVLSKIELELQECKKRMQAVEAENTLLKLGRVTRDTKFKDIEGRNKQLEEACAADRLELADMRTECESLKDMLAKENSAHLKARLSDRESDVERLTSAVNALSAEKSRIIASYAKLEKEHLLSVKERERKSKSNSQLEEKVDSLLFAQTEQRQVTESLVAENSRLTKELGASEAKSAQEKSENYMLSAELARLKDINATLLDKVPRLAAEIESARKNSTTRSKELASSREKNAVLMKDLDTELANKSQLPKLRETYAAQIKILNEKNGALAGELSSLKTELEEERKISAEFREECIVLSRSSFS